MPIDPIPPDARSTPRTMNPSEIRDWISTFPRMTAEHIDGALAHPNGFMGADPEGNWFAAYLLPDGNYSIEQIDAPYQKSAKEKNRMSTKPDPCLIVGPVLVQEGPPPRGPQRGKSLTDEILERRGEYLLSANREPFYGTKAEIDQIVAEALAANPGARLAESGEVRLALSEKMNRAEGRQPKPVVSIAANAKPVERGGRIEGTISKESYRESIRSSDDQAIAAHERVRATQRADGSFSPVGTTTPHEPLSSMRRPEDRDAHRGLGSYRINLDELRPVEKAMLKGVERRVCATEGCETTFSSAARRFCQIHGFNRGGRLGLKSGE